MPGAIKQHEYGTTYSHNNTEHLKATAIGRCI